VLPLVFDEYGNIDGECMTMCQCRQQTETAHRQTCADSMHAVLQYDAMPHRLHISSLPDSTIFQQPWHTYSSRRGWDANS
jgi:hypothetical protein